MLVQVLTNIINRKAREDLQLEGELDFPFYIPSSGEVLDQGTYFCALRVAIKHLELTRRAIVYDIRAKYQVRKCSSSHDWSTRLVAKRSLKL